MPEAPTLTVFKCAACAALDGTGSSRCRRCGGTTLEPAPVEGRGTLVSWTVVRRPAGAFADRPPFAVALIDLVEGVRITGNLDRFEPEPELGCPVVFADLCDDIPVFRVDRQ